MFPKVMAANVHPELLFFCFFLLDAAWVRSRAERPSVSYTKVTSKVAWTGHNLQFTKTNSNNKLAAATNSEKRGTGRRNGCESREIGPISEAHRMSVVQHCARVNLHGRRGAFFLARRCLGRVPGGAPFSQRSELATACTSWMQIKEPYKTN